jgi:hypothetical protein
MDLLMFYGLACVYHFKGYRSHGFQWLSVYFPIDYYRFRNYRNISAVFVFDNIVSISFSRKKVKVKVIWPPMDRFRSFSSLCAGVESEKADGNGEGQVRSPSRFHP